MQTSKPLTLADAVLGEAAVALISRNNVISAETLVNQLSAAVSDERDPARIAAMQQVITELDARCTDNWNTADAGSFQTHSSQSSDSDNDNNP